MLVDGVLWYGVSTTLLLNAIWNKTLAVENNLAEKH